MYAATYAEVQAVEEGDGGVRVGQDRLWSGLPIRARDVVGFVCGAACVVLDVIDDDQLRLGAGGVAQT